MILGLGSQTPGPRPGDPPGDPFGRLVMGGQTLAYILVGFFLIVAVMSARRDRS